ncbi:MAG: hypothetical protein R2882_06955 [Gemmatimonadales bacterium]
MSIFRRLSLAGGAVAFMVQALGIAALACDMAMPAPMAAMHAGHHQQDEPQHAGQPGGSDSDTHGTSHCLCAAVCQATATLVVVPAQAVATPVVASLVSAAPTPGSVLLVRVARPHSLPFALAPPRLA